MGKLNRKVLGVIGATALAIVVIAKIDGAFTPANRQTGAFTRASASKTANAAPPARGLPINFAENQGQTNPNVRFLVQGAHYAFFLTPNEVVMSLTRRSPNNTPFVKAALTDQSVSSEGLALALQFVGANPRVQVEGAEQAPGNMNYFRGNNPAEWRADVRSYAEIVYRDIWPAVDLRLREKNGALKYEFHVHPGARLSDIRLAYRGADRVLLDRTGNLSIETSMGTVRDSAPISFQENNGVRTPVESHYVLQGNTYSFAVGEGYRAGQDLIIDPGVEYSTFLGGTSNEIATGIAVDGAGNSYVVGWTQSPDYPTTLGAFDRSGAASNFGDVFVAKINPAGTALLYSTFIGGNDFDWGRAIAIDNAGNAYVTGQTKSSTFPTTGNAFDRTFNVLNCPRCGVDNYDAFVLKLNPTGSSLLYSTFLGGATDIDDGLGIAVDSAGSAYVAGETGSSDFPTTAGAFRRTRNGAYDAYVTKLNPSGSALVYSTFIGGADVDFASRIKVDASNNAYVLGNTRSADFPTTAGAFDTTANGGFDLFVLKLNAAGSNLIYSTFLGGLDTESAGGLAVDSAGNAYISGGSASSDYPSTPGAFQTAGNTTGNPGGGFVTKLNSTGSALVYSTFLGNAGATGLALTPAGNVWITGSASAGAIPVTPDAYQAFVNPGASGAIDAFLAELNGTGSALLYSTYLGGSQTDYGTDVALDSLGNIYVAGETLSSDFPVTPNALDRVFGGRLDIFWGDAFITKFALNGGPPAPPGLPTIASLATAVQVVGGNPAGVTVSLTSGAQGSGAIVSLSSSNPAVLSVPASLTIAAGSQSGTLTATSAAVAANTPVTITASYNNSSKAVTVTVLPVPPPAQLQSIGLFPNVVTGGTAALAILAVTNPAPTGGFTATLSTNNPIATVPATVTVPAGQTNVSFSVPTAVVTQSTGLTIFATAGGITQLAPLTVNPAAPPPPSNSTLSVTVSGRNGERVTSSPAGISVAVGSSGQASFVTGASVTLSVSNGRDAVWSGACSSGGSKTKTCTVTLNGAASVSANVQ